MSKFEGNIGAKAQGSIELDELFVTPGRQPCSTDRADALAQYLAAGEGWHDACSALGGTFAKAASRAAGPTSRLTRSEDV